MAQEKKSKRDLVNQIAGQYMAEPDDSNQDFYDQYLILCDEKNNGNESNLAVDFINMWQGAEYMTVNDVIDLIDGGVKMLEEKSIHPEFIQNIDWVQLKKQKTSLLTAIDVDKLMGNEEEVNNLQGIVHLIDAVQDYGVDKMGLDENIVFDLNDEE